jgi:hypothetical protein
MAAGQFVDAWRDGAEEDSDRGFRYQPRYLSEGGSSLVADVVLAETHHAVCAGELGLIYQDSLVKAAGCSLRWALFLKGAQLRPETLTEGYSVRGGRES